MTNDTYEMRAKERMIEDRKEVEEILTNASVGRLGMSLRDRPYIVPLDFVYHQGKIYFHSALEGRKISYLEGNNEVCFEVDESEIVPNVTPCEFTRRYRSVIAFGKVRFIQDPREKRAILNALVKKYDTGKIAVNPISEENLANLAVGEITLETVTGKRNDHPEK